MPLPGLSDTRFERDDSIEDPDVAQMRDEVDEEPVHLPTPQRRIIRLRVRTAARIHLTFGRECLLPPIGHLE